MTKSWCRLYSEFAFDPKIQSMSETMQRRFIMLMCLHTSNDNVTLHETEIAVALRISDDELVQTKAVFIQKKFINEQWKLLNWEERQFLSDSSTNRVQKHRETKKKQSGNVSVTPPYYRLQTQTTERTSSPLLPSPEGKATTIRENRIEEIPKPLTSPPANGHSYHAVEYHPRFNEVREYIAQRLPALARQNATEVNRWLLGGADVEADILPSVDYAIDIKGGDIGSYKYFTPSIESSQQTRKEVLEQQQRMREKYAKSN